MLPSLKIPKRKVVTLTIPVFNRNNRIMIIVEENWAQTVYKTEKRNAKC